MMKQNWKDDIRKKMEEHEAHVPDYLWDNVMKGVVEQRRKRMYIRRIAYAVSSCAAVAAMLILFLKVGYDNDMSTMNNIAHVNGCVSGSSKNSRPEDADKQLLEGIVTRSESKDGQLAHNSIRGSINSSETKHVTCSLKTESCLVAEYGAYSENSNSACHNEQTESVLSDVNGLHDKTAVADKKEEKKTNDSGKRENYGYREIKSADSNSACHVNERYMADNNMNDSGVMVGISVQNLMSSTSGLGNSSVNNLNLSHDYVTNNYANVTNAIGMYAARMEKKKAHHKNPLRASVSIAFPLMRHMYIESGLMYSYHSSDIQSVNDSYETDSKQYLHYIGIPLSMLYRVVDYRRLNVYVVGGGAVEKMVYGRQKIFDEAYKVSIDPLQFSVHLGGGVEYKLSDHVGIYVEPNINYYFKNNTSTSIIYQDKPWTPDLTIGLRIIK